MASISKFINIDRIKKFGLMFFNQKFDDNIKSTGGYIRGFIYYYQFKLYNYNKNPFCFLVGNKVVFDIDPEAQIIVRSGQLRIGMYEHPTYIPGRYNFKLSIAKKGQLLVDGNMFIGNGSAISIGENALLSFGPGGSVGGTRINCAKKISFGSGLIMSWNVDISDTDGHAIFSDGQRNGEIGMAEIKIGNDCWIGHDVVLLKGVEVGDGSIVGAGSTVSRDVPPGSIVGGNPIKVLKNGIKWSP